MDAGCGVRNGLRIAKPVEATSDIHIISLSGWGRQDLGLGGASLQDRPSLLVNMRDGRPAAHRLTHTHETVALFDVFCVLVKVHDTFLLLYESIILPESSVPARNDSTFDACQQIAF